MKVLILGGYGYIGSILYKELMYNGIPTTQYGKLFEEGIEDYNTIPSEILNEYTDIILLAGHSSVPSCNGELKSSWNNNVRNFNNLINKLDKKVRVIYASSSSVYGTAGKLSSVESNKTLDYLNNYDLTKSVLDEVAQNFINKDRQIVGLRFGTVCGGSPVLRTDILLNSMVNSAINKGKILVTNANINRPYLNIQDLASSILLILQNFTPGIYNLASGNNTIMEYAKAVSSTISADIQNNGNTPGVYDFSISCEKFYNTFGKQYSTSIEKTVEHIINHLEIFTTKLVTRLEYFRYTG